MKKSVLILGTLMLLGSTCYAQSKEDQARYKEWGKQGNLDAPYYVYNHKQFWSKNDPNWTLCKFALHFKQVTSDKEVTVNEDVGSTSNIRTAEAQSWAVLNGVSDHTFQEITDEFYEMFKARMADNGITVETWSSIKDLSEAEKIKDKSEKEEDRYIFNKHEGAATTKTVDGGPYYKHVIVFVPGGKKLSKEIKRLVMELDLIIDFAMFDVALNAYKESEHWEWDNYWGDVKVTTFASKASGNIYPVAHIAPRFGEGFGEGSLMTSKLFGHDQYGYTTTFQVRQPLITNKTFASEIIESHDLPEEIRQNYKTTKEKDGWNHFFIYDVKTTDEEYKEAVLDLLSKFLDELDFHIKMNQK